MIKFALTEDQSQKIKEWENNHNCPIEYSGAIGGKIKYTFIPTSLGNIEKVGCSCGQSIDVTEYELW